MIPDLDPDVAAFRGALRDLLRARDVRRLTREQLGTGGFDAALWATAAKDLGVQGLLVDEELGGSGDAIDAAVVAVDELEGNLAPGPFRSTLIATFALGRVADDLAATTLGSIADGSCVAVFVDARGKGELTDGRLDLTATVPHAGVADVAVVLDEGWGSRRVALLDLRSEGVTLTATDPFDVTRPGTQVTCAGVSVRAAEVDDDGAAAITDLALLLAGAEQVGVLRESLARTLSYCRDRQAFGRSVASFQAVKHQLALLHCELEQAVAVLDDAVRAMLSTPTRRRTAVLTARAVLGPMTVRVASECLRLRGGIGYTWEDDSHLFFRRARALEHAGIDPYAARRELAGLLRLT